jgi:hypothetical protein
VDCAELNGDGSRAKSPDCRRPPDRVRRAEYQRHSFMTGQLAGVFRQLKPLRCHLFEDGARLTVGRNLRQLQAMGGEGDILLSFVD